MCDLRNSRRLHTIDRSGVCLSDWVFKCSSFQMLICSWILFLIFMSDPHLFVWSSTLLIIIISDCSDQGYETEKRNAQQLASKLDQSYAVIDELETQSRHLSRQTSQADSRVLNLEVSNTELRAQLDHQTKSLEDLENDNRSVLLIRKIGTISWLIDFNSILLNHDLMDRGIRLLRVQQDSIFVTALGFYGNWNLLKLRVKVRFTRNK